MRALHLTTGPDQVRSACASFDLRLDGDSDLHRYNIAPTEQVLTIASPKGTPQAELMRWGLVPASSKDLKNSARMINARMETVTTSAGYRNLIPRASRRALQVAGGYYEWLKPEKRSESRQPFHVQVDDGAIFAFAALWVPAKIE